MYETKSTDFKLHMHSTKCEATQEADGYKNTENKGI